MEIITVFIKIIFDILSRFPRIFLLPVKWIYPLKKIESEIILCPRLDSPLSFHLATGNAVPVGFLALEIINASLLDITLERLKIDNLSVSLPGDYSLLISDRDISEPVFIKRGTSSAIFGKIELNEFQTQKLWKFKEEKEKYIPVILDITAIFKIKFYGELKKHSRLAVVSTIS